MKQYEEVRLKVYQGSVSPHFAREGTIGFGVAVLGATDESGRLAGEDSRQVDGGREDGHICKGEGGVWVHARPVKKEGELDRYEKCTDQITKAKRKALRTRLGHGRLGLRGREVAEQVLHGRQ